MRNDSEGEDEGGSAQQAHGAGMARAAEADDAVGSHVGAAWGGNPIRAVWAAMLAL